MQCWLKRLLVAQVSADADETLMLTLPRGYMCVNQSLDHIIGYPCPYLELVVLEFSGLIENFTTPGISFVGTIIAT